LAMQFIKLNWWKLILRIISCSVFYEIIFLFFISLNKYRTVPIIEKFYSMGFIALFGSAFFCVLLFLPNLIAFYFFSKKFADKSDESIRTLFDNEEYSIGLFSTKNPYYYTQPCLNGYISGYPTMISFYSIQTFRIMLNFQIVNPENNLAKTERKIILQSSVGVWNLFNNIKPKVLAFIDEFKQNGYLPGDHIY
jgi:hypothetical protein